MNKTIGEVMQTKVLALTLAMRLSDSEIYKAVIGYEDSSNPYRERPINIYVLIGPQSKVTSSEGFMGLLSESKKLSAQVMMTIDEPLEVSKESIVTKEEFGLKNSVREFGPLLNDDGAPIEKVLNEVGDHINALLERLDLSIDVWDDDKDDVRIAVIDRNEYNQIQEALSDAEYGL